MTVPSPPMLIFEGSAMGMYYFDARRSHGKVVRDGEGRDRISAMEFWKLAKVKAFATPAMNVRTPKCLFRRHFSGDGRGSA
jgi:hypothetical protein